MPSEIPVYCVTSEEYAECVKSRTPYSKSYSTPFKIGIYKEFDLYSFHCRLYYNNRILTGQDTRQYSGVNDFFEKGKEFYFTSNGVVFYKVIDIRVDVNNYLELAIILLSKSPFVEKNQFFMIMPFRYESLNEFYNESIKNFLERNLNVKVYRADQFTDTDVIADTIIRQIEQAEFVICDITHPNKNVFFEIGYAKALGKQMILLMEAGASHDFFDLAHIRRIEYSFDSLEIMQARLIDTIKTIRGNNL